MLQLIGSCTSVLEQCGTSPRPPNFPAQDIWVMPTTHAQELSGSMEMFSVGVQLLSVTAWQRVSLSLGGDWSTQSFEAVLLWCSQQLIPTLLQWSRFLCVHSLTPRPMYLPLWFHKSVKVNRAQLKVMAALDWRCYIGTSLTTHYPTFIIQKMVP